MELFCSRAVKEPVWASPIQKECMMLVLHQKRHCSNFKQSGFGVCNNQQRKSLEAKEKFIGKDKVFKHFFIQHSAFSNFKHVLVPMDEFM